MTQTKKRIAGQGISGAFHEIAAQKYFAANEVEYISAETFEDLIEVSRDPAQTDGGIMAIENTIAGTILKNYRLLSDSGLTITGEINLRIKHNFMALPGQGMEAMREARSHYMAIEQCRSFFKSHPQIKLVEASDTALSAAQVAEQKLEGVGAIASALAAEKYGLEIIAPSIETNKKNFTRFLILDRKKPELDNFADKVSIFFSLDHKVGSLHGVLGLLAVLGANLTKIQSIPLPGSTWRYFIFLDFVLEDPEDYDLVIRKLIGVTTQLHVLGRYRQGGYFE